MPIRGNVIQPIHVRVDLEAHAAYVKYAPGPSVSTIDLNDTGSLAYDVDEAGTIIGIEVLEIQMPEQIALRSAPSVRRGCDERPSPEQHIIYPAICTTGI
jgi:uncharacterized protein YuzE